jgi:hypothetical protein
MDAHIRSVAFKLVMLFIVWCTVATLILAIGGPHGSIRLALLASVLPFYYNSDKADGRDGR